MSRAARDRVPLARSPWVCEANFLLCSDEHLLALYKAAFRGDFRRLSGHTFLECRECKPPTYFCAVFAKIDGLASVTCYDISRECYVEWDKGNDPTPTTPELLYRLRDRDGRSHNPYWRPTKQ